MASAGGILQCTMPSVPLRIMLVFTRNVELDHEY